MRASAMAGSLSAREDRATAGAGGGFSCEGFAGGGVVWFLPFVTPAQAGVDGYGAYRLYR
ncbi:hypothetical protein ASG37_13280 [Sphingomonas sp. Leaf407]|nr:hypothetical protein ASE97_12535 [Sphingomonas sp. Leaf42]KQT27184.1 hypothetical protein ASG37_13280 [Sphingomonas sp. Leaf407]